ncbi:MAG TPA: bifunctional hydroxymethylpyrimidine kinase/phosphomethylpyrimidine kinase [Thermomicrobiales bacterium]|nr:bifunctional hydroxymethylpyrimidine kinase/phosphomethylpyrimidine kinase [Thermomicrobiales bacterium]
MHHPATNPPHVMTIGGSDSGAGSGVQADLKTFAALGTYGTSILTAVTAQNTREVAAIAEVPEEIVIAQIDTVAEDIGAQAIKTGMLGNRKLIQNVVDRLEAWGIPHLVVDPVMVSGSGVPLLASDALAPLRDELLPLAAVVTANLDEASALTGIDLTSRSQMEEAARALREMGPSVVVIEGGQMEDLKADLVMNGDTTEWLEAPPAPTPNAHGAGCTLSAAIAALLAHDCEPFEAIRLARLYLTNALEHAYRVGEGLSPVNHFAPLPEEIADRIGQWTRA